MTTSLTAAQKIQEIRDRAAAREAAFVAEAIAAIATATVAAEADPSESNVKTWQAVCGALRATGACSVPNAEVAKRIAHLAALVKCERCYRHSVRLAVAS